MTRALIEGTGGSFCSRYLLLAPACVCLMWEKYICQERSEGGCAALSGSPQLVAPVSFRAPNLSQGLSAQCWGKFCTRSPTTAGPTHLAMAVKFYFLIFILAALTGRTSYCLKFQMFYKIIKNINIILHKENYTKNHNCWKCGAKSILYTSDVTWDFIIYISFCWLK